MARRNSCSADAKSQSYCHSIIASETCASASPLSIASRRLQAASLAAAVEHLERDLIRAALDRSQGNISETARQLGLTRRGLYLKLRRLGLEMPAEMDTQ